MYTIKIDKITFYK